MASCKYKPTFNILGEGVYSNVKEVKYKDQLLSLKIFDNQGFFNIIDSSEKNKDVSQRQETYKTFHVVSKGVYADIKEELEKEKFKPLNQKKLQVVYPKDEKSDIFGRRKQYTTLHNPSELDVLFTILSKHLVHGFSDNEEVGIVEIAECDFNSPGVVTLKIDHNLIRELKTLDFTKKRKIMKDIAFGIQCLHRNNYLYLDCKLQNCMYNDDNDKDNNTKVVGVLIDFGSVAKVKDIGVGIKTETPRMLNMYRPPESMIQIQGNKYYYNNKSDVYALGILFCQILSNNYDFLFESIYTDLSEGNFKSLQDFQNTFMNEKTLGKYIDVIVSPKIEQETPSLLLSEYKDNYKDLLKQMLNMNPSSRLNIDGVLGHPFFKEGGDVCQVIKPIDYSLSKVKKEDFLGIYNIIEYCQENLWNVNIKVFFMAIDLYLRYIYKVSAFSLQDLPKLCCLAALKYYYWSELKQLSIEQYTELTSDKFILEEIRLYKAFSGRINQERYFKNAKSHIELFLIYKEFIYPFRKDLELKFNHEGKEYIINRNIIQYLNTDAEKKIAELGRKEVDNIEELTIEKFFRT
jgi:serine/threonine protein kinase